MLIILIGMAPMFGDLGWGALWWLLLILNFVALLCGLGAWWSLGVHQRLWRLYESALPREPASAFSRSLAAIGGSRRHSAQLDAAQSVQSRRFAAPRAERRNRGLP
ncbi:hypothetical protein [Microbacterium sp. BK668]|uniref:hypothetical protein n=1 Tax=Microbacterium sp. BK668 TaxID=2512118 RepID=UPI00105B2364|nr:hypothetical protein [Microbacterium sp. BK668]